MFIPMLSSVLVSIPVAAYSQIKTITAFSSFYGLQIDAVSQLHVLHTYNTYHVVLQSYVLVYDILQDVQVDCRMYEEQS